MISKIEFIFSAHSNNSIVETTSESFFDFFKSLERKFNLFFFLKNNFNLKLLEINTVGF